MQFKPLLANWVEVAIFAFIIISSLVGQLFKAAQAQRKRAQKKAGQPMGPGQAPGQPVADARPKSTLEKEIEAFLRKQLGGPEPAQPKPPPPPPARKPTRQTPPRPRPVARSTPRPTPRPTLPAFPETESVAGHVQRHILSEGLGQRDAHLGEQTGQADERMESHLQEVFQHRLGTLESETSQTGPSIRQGTDAEVWSGAPAGTPVSAQLFQMLASPQHVQAAIVLSEILRRPDERWS